MLGSLLCGLASVRLSFTPRSCHIERHDLISLQNYVLLCIYRAVAGVGGGGIVSAVWLITAELVEENQRAQWSQALSVTWSASAVAGKIASPKSTK